MRGRVKSDLLEFAKRAGVGRAEVFEDDSADYRYRLILSRVEVSRVLSEAVDSMGYDNFKARVEEAQGEHRERVYCGIWSHLNRHLS